MNRPIYSAPANPRQQAPAPAGNGQAQFVETSGANSSSETDDTQNAVKKSDLKYCYRYPHAAITADCVIFGFNGKSLKILLIERGNEPFLGYWALPGGFMRMDETIEETAARELREETNLTHVYLDQFRVYSKVGRDPRERVVTVAFIALVKPDDYKVLAGDDAANAMWFDDDMLPPLAFDHAEIISEAREHLKQILLLKPVAFELLNKTFTISQLQTVYEVINRTSYDRRNFLRTAIDSDIISEVKNSSDSNSGRNVKLYTLNDSCIPLPDDSCIPLPDDSCIPLPDDGCIPLPDDSPDSPGLEYFNSGNSSRPERESVGLEYDKEDIPEERMKKTKRKAERKAPTKGLFGFFNRFSD